MELGKGRKGAQNSRTFAVPRFDLAAGKAYAEIVVRARRHGHPISVADAQIAAIAAARRFSVATRDEAPFNAAGVPVINPWTAGDAP